MVLFCFPVHRCLAGLCLLFWLNITCAENTDDAEILSLDRQRANYALAKEALRSNDAFKFNQYKKKLQNYPLYQHLEYADLAINLRRAPIESIDAFLAENQDSPIADRLRYSWLKYQMKRDNWRLFLKYYQPTRSTTGLQCYYQLARYRNGEKSLALEAALKLWNVGKSQPKECDNIFAILVEQGYITEDIAWQRYSSAVLHHNYRLARYLERFFVTEARQKLAHNFYSIDRHPETVGNYQLLEEQTPEVSAVIAHGLRHLAHEDARKALVHWSHYQQTHTFDVATRTKVVNDLVKGLHQQDYKHVADGYLIDNRELVTTDLLEWRARRALFKLDWHDLLSWIGQMPPELQNENRWRYWKRRAEQEIDPLTQQGVDDQVLQELALTRSFYGFLAAEQLGNGYSMAYQPAIQEKSLIEELSKNSGVIRTRELLHHNDHFLARLEWQHTTRNFTEQQWIAAAHVTREWNWYNGTINSMIRAAFWDDIKLRFPLGFRDIFDRYAAESSVPAYLLLALARQESAMSHDVTSPAGAKGLMQLMPATARQTAQENGVEYRNSSELFKPELNIKLGSRYYLKMLKRFDYNRILATAAYNAGPNRVERWLQESAGKLPFDVWIENIPYQETRGYVQNVLAFSMIYAHQMDLNERMLSKAELERLL
ncbi:MAG: transglycosylase SLT domain-containing protein [Porticoccaceae bacterium]